MKNVHSRRFLWAMKWVYLNCCIRSTSDLRVLLLPLLQTVTREHFLTSELDADIETAGVILFMLLTSQRSFGAVLMFLYPCMTMSLSLHPSSHFIYPSLLTALVSRIPIGSNGLYSKCDWSISHFCLSSGCVPCLTGHPLDLPVSLIYPDAISFLSLHYTSWGYFFFVCCRAFKPDMCVCVLCGGFLVLQW
jgi:hypothetical protein